VVDGTDNEPTSGDQQTGEDRASASGAGREKPVSFDFNLRLGSREETSAQRSGRATGELVQLQPIDWDALVAPPVDEPRAYQTDGDLQSMIVELANQIAGPDTSSHPVVHVTASATIETSRPTASSPPAAPAPAAPAETLIDEPVRAAIPVLQPFAPLAPKLAPLPTTGRPSVTETPAASVAAIEDRDPDQAGDHAEHGPASAVAAETGSVVAVAEVVAAAQVVEAADGAADVTAAPADAADVDAQLAAAAAVAIAAHAARTAAEAAPPAPAVTELPAPVAAPVLSTPEPPAHPTVPAPPAPPAPAAPIAPLTLGRIERKANAERPTKPVDFHALLGQAGLLQPAVRRRKKRRPFVVLFKLLVLLGIVGAGLYVGKVYVLDKRWDAELKPFAEAVSTERGLEWKHPVKMETLPADDYATKLATSWLGITDVQLVTTAAEWRAMGLAEGRIESGAIGSGAMSSRPVFYDPVDAKIYELEDLPEALRELSVDRALTMALLDQHYGWSTDLADLEPAERTAVRALFDGDSLSTAMAIVDPDDADSAELVEQMSEIVAGRAASAVGAPRYAVDLVGAAGGIPKLFDDADGLAVRDELLRSEPRTDAAIIDAARGFDYRPDDLRGDLTETRGLLYWYYVLAGRLAPAESWDAALAWDGDKVVVSETANGVCVTATIAIVDEAGRLRLLDALQRWAAAGPLAAGATVTEIGTEQLSVFSCDPGVGSDTVLNDQIQTFGESVVELTVIGGLGARTDVERACVVNAVRAYDVPAIVATGDQAQIDPAVQGIGAACVG
jgi:hypothetical protein